jgi:hypothetical protein
VNKLTLPALTVLSVAMLSGVALAGPGGKMGPGGPGFVPPMLQKFDTNGDGVLSKDELEAAAKAGYAEANTDGADGVTLQEFEPWFWKQHREMMVRAFQRLDRDGDGKVTEDEAKAGADRMADRFDRMGGPMGRFGGEAAPGWGGWFRGGPDGGHGWFGGHKGMGGRMGMGMRDGSCMTPPPAGDVAPAEAPAQ